MERPSGGPAEERPPRPGLMIKHGLNGLHFNERRSDSVAVHNCDTRRW